MNSSDERRTAVDYAREAANEHDPARSTNERQRPVSVTSLDELRAAAGLRLHEVEWENDLGQRQVVRIHASDVDDAVEHADVDPDAVLDVRQVGA